MLSLSTHVFLYSNKYIPSSTTISKIDSPTRTLGNHTLPSLKESKSYSPSHSTMSSSSDKSYDTDSTNNSILRYAGYKHSSPVYEDFKMWYSVCEDAEPGWEYKESQRQNQKKEKEAARKEKEIEKNLKAMS